MHGIQIPLDDEIKKALKNNLYVRMKEVISDDNDLQKLIATRILNSKDYFKFVFKPIVKEMIEDLDFNVSFNTGWEDEDD